MPVATKLDELQQQIATLQKEHATLLANQKAEAIEQIDAMIRTYGIKPGDLNFGNRMSKGSYQPRVEAKYKHGANLWSGRGRKPKWVEDHLAKGGKLDDLLIK